MPYWLEIIINFSFAWVSAVGFALIINVPRRALVFCGLSGAVSWMVYWFCTQLLLGRLVSNLIATTAIGVLSFFFAKKKKCPMSVFTIPGIMPLVPGVSAYQAVSALVDGRLSEAEDLLLRVVIIIIAIAIGFMISQLIIEVYNRFTKSRKNKKNLV